ncbi:hypothetical protein DPMN_122565 [Dreissena polymorpha]|uniref:Uncharacterized protein n=1 Tax=Dreissena polymorpha TaxID=45954 RepID=A0A9D4GNT9_DREPO|nr:hypothetical protein DPMN_122565 [Dreissena polymorpha]
MKTWRRVTRNVRRDCQAWRKLQGRNTRTKRRNLPQRKSRRVTSIRATTTVTITTTGPNRKWRRWRRQGRMTRPSSAWGQVV